MGLGSLCAEDFPVSGFPVVQQFLGILDMALFGRHF
jgi:hypothetical protein